MSQEDVEIVRAVVEAAGTMDKPALVAALPELIAQACDPDIEWIEDPQRADARVYQGHQGVRRSWEQWLDHFTRPSSRMTTRTHPSPSIATPSASRSATTS